MTELIRAAPLAKQRFDALAGYARDPLIFLLVQELEWYAAAEEKLVGTVTVDRTDKDYGWVVMARDKRLRFRGVSVAASISSLEEARVQLFLELEKLRHAPAEEFHQGDESEAPTDFFTPVVTEDRLHPIFKQLIEGRKFSPARGIVEAMMRFYDDLDGNFVEQFQTVAFDARLWEVYLFAAFVEAGFVRLRDVAIPDFVFRSPFGVVGVEATTLNPSKGPRRPPITNNEEAGAYLENYIPIKLARALRKKLERSKPYWDEPAVRGYPFVLAVQDFHSHGSMRLLTHAATEYVFGVRHTMRDGKIHVEWIDEHVFGKAREKSGFFRLPNVEHISAVIINPQGTLNKFNRLGYVAEFGDRNIRIIRRGYARAEHRNPADPRPVPFVHKVYDPGYSETWVEGMVVLHNPRALVPLPPEFLENACHEFLQDNGKIMSRIPEFHPYLSETGTFVPEEQGT